MVLGQKKSNLSLIPSKEHFLYSKEHFFLENIMIFGRKKDFDTDYKRRSFFFREHYDFGRKKRKRRLIAGEDFFLGTITL